IEKLHAEDPADRFEGAALVAETLGRHLAQLQQPSQVQQPSGLGQPVVPRPTGRQRRRRWVVAAAAVVLLFGGLSWTEATGLTELAATVIRVITPDGTLVVEVDDPGVKVAVEGEGEEIVITGAGVHEVRLRPGEHRWRATQGDRL